MLNQEEATIHADVRRRIQALGPGGGFSLAPGHHIQHGIPPENVVAVYVEARAFGRYPLKR